jgi:hypothetical protein
MSSRVWDTESELRFLRRLGKHRETRRPPGSNRILPMRPWRLLCLRGYVLAAQMPRDWGRIDPEPCLAYARDEIKRMEAGGAAFL